MRHNIGDSGLIIRELPVLCGCGYVAPVGTKVTIRRRTSDQPGIPRVVEVLCENGTIHKVKLSKIWFEGEGV